MDLLNNEYFNIITAVIALASAITAVTPTPKDDGIIKHAYKIIEFLGLVIGRAKDR